MDKRDDYKQTIMNMETVLAKLLTLDHSMSEQQLDMQIPQLLEQIGEYTQSDRFNKRQASIKSSVPFNSESPPT